MARAQELCDNSGIAVSAVIAFGSAMMATKVVENEPFLAAGAFALTFALGVSGIITARNSIRKMYPDVADEVAEMQTKKKFSGK